MGLQKTANYLQSKGRGKDTMLVHMSPREVKGLQALALAHGGSLTINPDTGLPEAGFLERILPVVAGAGLMMIPGVGPLAAAAMVGGGYGLATGSVEKGLMAGLGAYGGAGLAGSLSAVGGQAAAQAGQQAATEGFKTVANEAVTQGSQQVAQEAAKTAAAEGLTLPSNYADLYAKTGGAQEFTKQAAQGYLENANNFSGLTPETLKGYQGALNAPGANPQDVIGAAGRAQGAAGATTGSNIATGLKEVSSSVPAAGSFLGSNIGTIGSAAVPLLVGDQQQGAGPAGYQEDEYDRRLQKYKLSPNYQAYEAPRPNPYYQAQYASGGITSLQGGGGPVERMSMMNTAMNPQGGLYPQGMIDKTQYAVPTQRPVSSEMVMNDSAYERSNPMLMASGGIASYRNKGQVNVLQDYLDRQKQQQINPLPESVGVPRTGIFRDADVDTARKPADQATNIKLGKAFKAAGIKPVALPKTSIKGLGDISGVTQDTTEAAAGGTMRYNLGGYSDGGRMLKGPGDGMSDSIPATIAGKQPARLADGEFVVPADVVSHLGNGSTDAGAKKLYGMMDKIRKARTGKKKQAPAVKASRYMPA
jgi:hypothetical protein|tara:strand:- start:1624 stop:3390 length:1767 start_codon:yes stop_codon:yes gene_type:complete